MHSTSAIVPAASHSSITAISPMRASPVMGEDSSSCSSMIRPNREMVSAPPPPLFRLEDIIQRVVGEATQAHEARLAERPLGPVTGLKKVDEKMSGRLPPGLVPILGNTGAGKSAFGLQVSTSCGCPSLYISCEMSCAELFRRHMARVCNEYLNRFKSGEMPPSEVEAKAYQAAQAAPQLAIMDATQSYPSPPHILQVAEAVRGESDHLLIVMDSLHSWVESSASGVTEYEALNAGLARLREIAQYLTCPLLVISERNRASAESGGVNAGAGTRRIEYGAEIVFDLHREKDAVPGGQGEVPVSLRFAKNRHGAPGETVPLHFYGALQKFQEI